MATGVYLNLLNSLNQKIDETLESGSIAYYEAKILAQQYCDAREKLAEASASDIQSYSHTGISIQKRDLLSLQTEVDRLRSALMRILAGCVTVADLTEELI